MRRTIVHYRGQVQGVGFRARVERLARGFRVTGYVINLPDGRVRLVIEGEAAEIDAVLQEVVQAMGDWISDVQTQVTLATGEFSEFRIRY